MPKAEKKSSNRRLTGAYVSAVISISLVLLLLGVALTLIANARKVSDYFKESMQISLICTPGTDEAGAAACTARLDTLPFVRSTSIVSREQGEKELREMLGEEFLSVFETAPIPVSIDLSLKAEYVSADSLKFILPVLEGQPEVEEVDSRQSLVESLNKNLSGISLVLGVFILLLLFISIVLIGNTVRLSLHARRFTIHTMRLVGATGRFIRKPFLRSAFWQGLIAGVLADGVLALGLYFVRKSFPQIFAIFDPVILGAVGAFILLCGIIICVAATFFVVNSLLASGEDELYY